MKKLLTTLLFFFFLAECFGQTRRNISTYLQLEYNKTMYDKTRSNNPWGIGLGVQTFFFNKIKFKPTLELTADAYLEDDKVLRTENGEALRDVRGMVNLFGGLSLHPVRQVYISFTAGPSFVGGQTLFGIKPSLGFYFSRKQKWTGRLSYINVFNRGDIRKEDFGSLSLSLGVKLF